MDVHLHGACMGKLVGPAGGGGAGGGGISTQFRILPNNVPSECYSVDSEKVPVACHRPALHLRVSSAPSTPHRTFSPEPLKISEDYLAPGLGSPVLEGPAGFLLHDSPAAVRRPALVHSAPASSPKKDSVDLKLFLDDGGADSTAPESEVLMVGN